MKDSILRPSWGGTFGVLAVCLGFLIGPVTRAEISPKYYAVEASVSVQESPARITLSWPSDPRATGYTIHRKAPGSDAWGPKATLPGNALSYTDSDIGVGAAYEYRISKTTSLGYQGFAYVYAGVRAPLIEHRGKLLLIVDNTYAADLAPELARLQQDLVGDGWIVVRHDVSRQDSPSRIKALIKKEYDADPANVRSVFLFGHVPVPYSGNFTPDAHGDHQGAWPADAYYGDMDGTWTDHSVNTRSAERSRNWNVPGDGKFDPSDLPSDVELEVGRVDLSNMTCFANKALSRSEKDLLRQYLNKDHNFRHGKVQVARRGLICDSFGERQGEAFAASGWRNFSVFFGANNVYEVPGGNYFSTVSSQSYLWSYGTGGGSFYTCNGIGSSDDFATTDIKTVFTMFLGSYFGDWDNESNFLRAPLGSTSYTLTSSWAGRPHWFYHHMALGETIGYSTRLSQNNRSGGPYALQQNNYSRQVHVALMGDPTLRMHPVLPPSGVQISGGATGVVVSWKGSGERDLLGYHVYRSDSPQGPFQRVTRAGLIHETTMSDPTGSDRHTYMVRAIKLERAASGSYLNPSQGAFSVPLRGGTAAPLPPIVTAPSAPPEPGPKIEPKAVFVRKDTSARGDWKGKFGSDGFHIIGDAVKYPPYAVVTSNGHDRFEWGDSTTDPRGLQRQAGGGRVPACWFSDSNFTVEVNFVDGRTHRLALYCVDWDTTERSQKVEILDPNTGAVLDTRTISGFNSGAYLVWDVQGRVQVRISRTGGNNAVLMGLFFDPGGEQPGGSAELGQAPMLRPVWAAGKVELRIQGQAGQRFRIEASADLRNWSAIGEVTLANAESVFRDPQSEEVQVRYYRAVQVP